MSDQTPSTMTGFSRQPFERACYAVIRHDDGTGTIVLDWYETSEGCDFMTQETFMRTDISVARQVVALLNSKLPTPPSAKREYGDDDTDVVPIQDREAREQMAARIHAAFNALFRVEPIEEQQESASTLEKGLEEMGQWVAQGRLTPKD